MLQVLLVPHRVPHVQEEDPKEDQGVHVRKSEVPNQPNRVIEVHQTKIRQMLSNTQ